MQPSTYRLRKLHMHLTEHCLCPQSLPRMPCTLWLTQLSTCQLHKPRTQWMACCLCRRFLKHMLCMPPQPEQKMILECNQHKAFPGSSRHRPDHLHSLYKTWLAYPSTCLWHR